MRKPKDDREARLIAQARVDEHVMNRNNDEATGAIFAEFPDVEFERTTAKIPGGGTVAMRRLVLTGPWETDPTPPSAEG